MIAPACITADLTELQGEQRRLAELTRAQIKAHECANVTRPLIEVLAAHTRITNGTLTTMLRRRLLLAATPTASNMNTRCPFCTRESLSVSRLHPQSCAELGTGHVASQRHDLLSQGIAFMISSARNHASRCYRVSLEGLVDEGLKPRNRNRSDVEFNEGHGRKLLDVVFCTTAANAGDGSKSLPTMDHPQQTATRSKKIKYSDILRQKECDKDTELIVVAVDNFGRMQKQARARVMSLITPQANHMLMAKTQIRERRNRLQITIFDALAIVDIHTYRTLDNQ